MIIIIIQKSFRVAVNTYVPIFQGLDARGGRKLRTDTHTHTHTYTHTNTSCGEEYLNLVQATIILGLLRRRRRCRRTFRKVWVRLIYRWGLQQGDYHNLLQEMRLSDPEGHFKFLRMSRENFDSLLQMVYTLFYLLRQFFLFLLKSKSRLLHSCLSLRLFQSLKA